MRLLILVVEDKKIIEFGNGFGVFCDLFGFFARDQANAIASKSYIFSMLPPSWTLSSDPSEVLRGIFFDVQIRTSLITSST